MNSDKVNKIKQKIKDDKENALQKIIYLIANGANVKSPEDLHISGNLTCGHNVTFDVNVIIEGEVILEDNVIIEANCILKNCKIGKNTLIKSFSIIDGSVIGENSFLGPYARIRPNVMIGNNVQIGNFVEIKNSNIDSYSRINHLAFVGDTDIADRVTIGAGTITCNHDGNKINRTVIDSGAYVGSGCNLVAPLIINANATIASGSTITDEVSSDTLTIARSRQITIANWQGPKSSE
jgi:bifunctional UDP-N-acetylglucosamine pyrophosphorylase / glucosamine-1-phosphate N-acetyltransferase